MTEDSFTPYEIAFLRRLAFHAERGLSYEEAVHAISTEDNEFTQGLPEQMAQEIRLGVQKKPSPRARGKLLDDRDDDLVNVTSCAPARLSRYR